MPVMGGKEMADALHASHPDTKVLFTSGYTGILGASWRAAAGHWIPPKPYMTATLARKVREVLDEGLIQSC